MNMRVILDNDPMVASFYLPEVRTTVSTGYEDRPYLSAGLVPQRNRICCIMFSAFSKISTSITIGTTAQIRNFDKAE